MQILDVTTVRLDAVDEMLDNFVTQFAAQLSVVLKNGAHCLSFQQLIDRENRRFNIIRLL